MAIHIQSGVTVANTVSTVTFASWYRSLEVVNRSSGDMWVRFDGVDPTIAGDECFFVAAQSFIQVSNPKLPPEVGTSSNSEIRMITAATANYTVSGGV